MEPTAFADQARIFRAALDRAGIHVFGAFECLEEFALFIDGGTRDLLRLSHMVIKARFSEYALGIEERLFKSFPDWHPSISGGRRRWLRLMLRDPNCQARKRVRPLSASAAEFGEAVLAEVDLAIRPFVISAREHGLPTVSSCEGHNGNPGHLAVLGGRRVATRTMEFLRTQGIEPGFLSLSSRYSADKLREFRMATLDFWVPSAATHHVYLQSAS